MNRVIGRSLSEIRQEFGLPYLPARAVAVAIHEAAHATVALAHGADVGDIYIRADNVLDGDDWYGTCSMGLWGLSNDDRNEIDIAGIAGQEFADSSIGDNPCTGARGDFERLQEAGVTDVQLRGYYESAVARLEVNQGVFDRFASELLTLRSDGMLGEISASDVPAIAKPGMSPDKGSNPIHWTGSQRQSMADIIERYVAKYGITADIRQLLEATPPRAKQNIQYSDAVSSVKASLPNRYWNQSRREYSSKPPGGYEHRALEVGR